MSLKSFSETFPNGFIETIERQRREADEAEAKRRGLGSVDELHAIRVAEHEAKERANAERLRVNHVRDVLAAVGPRVSDAVASALLAGDGLADTPAHLTVCEWLATTKPVLVLSGGTGTGKTVAAVRAMLSAHSYQFIRSIRVGAHFERWSSDREDGIDPLNLGCGLLVLDDLGQEPVEDRRAMPAIEEILDHRQSARTRTLITTNLSADGLRSRYSERIVSRLRQNATVKAIGAVDMRGVR